jgi:imidazolonepropionase-like amidohydrolase
MILRHLLAFLLLGFLPFTAAAERIAVIGERVWTGTQQGTIENGVVIIENGLIVSVGAEIPGDVTREVRAAWVTPGLISAFSRTGLAEVSGERSTNDISAGGSPFSAALNAADGYNPEATPVAVMRADGFTRLAVAPDAAGRIFGGQGFLADTTSEPGGIFRPRAFAYVVLGERGASLAGGSRAAAWGAIRGAFDDVRFFAARYMAHSEGNVLTRMDAQALIPAVRGDQLILIEARRASDLEAIMAFKAENTGLRVAIVGADEAWRVAPQLAAANIPVIIDAVSNLPASFSQLAATAENASRLAEAGAEFAIVNFSDNSHQARLARQSAGNAAANGLDFDAAMRALTVTPASIFRMEGLGRLVAGARADVVAWDGDPLEVTSAPEAVFIDGVEQPLDNRQTRLRDRYLSLDESELPLAYRR